MDGIHYAYENVKYILKSGVNKMNKINTTGHSHDHKDDFLKEKKMKMKEKEIKLFFFLLLFFFWEESTEPD